MTTNITDFTRQAREHPQSKYSSLMGMLFDAGGLYESFARQPVNKASGVDGIGKEDYAEGLGDRLDSLSQRLRRLGYRPKPARRVYIPKADGRQRPLGIPSFEDRIVQDRLSRILEAIWEPEFRDCSYGFRPNRNAHDALRRLGQVITYERTQWVVEADIKGFFDHVDHGHLMRFLEHRIADPGFLRIIKRFLKSGVQEDGRTSSLNEGTPQGGLVSPVLANIYLHYVLDWWFEGKVAKQCRGKAFLVRYADDFVACFQLEEDARRFSALLPKRLAEFALEVEPSKTGLTRFGCFAKTECCKDGDRRPRTFAFLGFTHFVGKSRKGRFVVGRKTERRRFCKKLKEVGSRLRRLRHKGAKAMLQYTRRHLQGHLEYFAVSGNSKSICAYVHWVGLTLYKWLNRRSQRRSCKWVDFCRWWREGRLFLPIARIRHNLYPVPP